MKKTLLRVRESRQFGEYGLFRLEGEFEPSLPGQFYMLKGDWGYTPFLGRPISILTEDKHTVSFLVKILGEGSRKLAEVNAGETLTAIGPLGNSFPLDRVKKGDSVLMIGGGVGVPPLYYLSEKLIEKEILPVFCQGARTKDDLLLLDELKGLSIEPVVTTEDGSVGKKGFVTDAAKSHIEKADFIFACGPKGMLISISRLLTGNAKTYFSLEERMACGFGICLGCACGIKGDDGEPRYERVCVEGPIFEAGKIIWE
jgi:dihydroorotate dehydrogenase electron transfer subunit